MFERDDHRCRCCGRDDLPLDAHHITNRNDMPNGGYAIENGIALCSACHKLAEKNTQSKENVPYSPGQLYARIGSSYSVAYEASKRLGRYND
jgi:5-methylcytosine-specific restriction endonuclease McrA